MKTSMTRAAAQLKTICLAALPLMAVAWIPNLTVVLGVGIIGERFVLVAAGVTIAATLNLAVLAIGIVPAPRAT
jgi:hypothetical protein